MINNVDNLLTKLATSEESEMTLQFLKSTIINLAEIVKEQQTMIDHQAGRIQGYEALMQDSKNAYYSLSKRVLDLERYSRKLCLIFDSVDVSNDGGLSSALNLMQSALKMHIGPQDIAACHPLTNGECVPVIVKFIYHYHRDLAWDRKTSLRFQVNSHQRPINIRECLAPIDRDIQAEAKRLNLRTVTRNQQVFVHQGRNQPSYKINHIEELKSFQQAENTNSTTSMNRNAENSNNVEMISEPAGNSTSSNPVFVTPLAMPKLYRKPNTPFFDENRSKKRALALSPLNESPQSGEESLVSILAEALLPALNKIMKQCANQKDLGDSNAEPDPNGPFQGESTGD